MVINQKNLSSPVAPYDKSGSQSSTKADIPSINYTVDHSFQKRETSGKELSEATPQVTQSLSNQLILTTLNDLYNWARLSSLWPLLYGTSCCFIEFASLLGSRFDFDRFGLVPRSSPRQADLIITAGTVTMKMAPSLVRLYEQMPEPKYVIAMGACTITGGMFSTDSYSTVRGVDKLIPVDVYLPGCPPKPEAIIDAVIKLRKKVAQEDFVERNNFRQIHRYYSISHEFKSSSTVHTGKYLQSSERKSPPKELSEATGIPIQFILKNTQKTEIQP
uniref:NAD(P)H-quinone oxidoreductase subunit K, chloroplastic n=2 Tax=Chlorokybus atmophyticus TaxID=3144 RepID=NDHK_CHLAT|nr:RecName: Full=NAD(P)H-quinone oxidoreductase subunit K, chloroplastic; AltName: Full=NAD(P)H dehydrogenase subunit K; AltName: Full=NADH-plastoquinone oxidoreductase subunit K [Chlorokybus atmophyticus]